MAFDLSSGYGAGAGADMLQDILRQKAAEAFRNQQLAQEQQRIAIESERAKQQAAYQAEALRSLQEQRAATAELRQQQSANAVANELAPGSVLDATGASTLRAGNLGSLIQHQGAVLPSTQISGIAEATKAAPRIIGLATTPSAGHGEQDVFTGTAAQRQAEQAFQERLAQFKQQEADRQQARQDKFDAAAQAAQDKQDLVRLTASLRPAKEAPTVVVQTVDANGNPVTRIVPKTAGAEFAKPVGAQVENRVKSAETVNQVGNDIIQKLSDPKVTAALGPALGRYSKLQDFIGNPPPEYAELAGEIESYALANMGVHGMRSAQGAEQIKKLLEGHHTPQSLAATIRGLNNFSEKFVQNSKPGSASAGSNTGSGFKVVEIK